MDSNFPHNDSDNDNSSGSCSFSYQGGWWYKSCYVSNLNGPHTLPSTPGVDSVAKLMINSGRRDVSSVEMKIRAKNCNEVLPEESTNCQ